MLRAMQILRSIALLAFCASSASAAETDTGAIPSEEVIEEVVVKGVNRCGTWPIQHERLIGCEYVELSKEDLAIVLDLRPKLFSACLSCQGNRCIANEWPEDKTMQELLCKIVFWTPTGIMKFIFEAERSNPSREYSDPFRVSFTFTVSTKGRVEDIEVVSFEGDIAEKELLELIERGATKTRFEPVVFEDKIYEIVGIKDAFKLDDS